MAAKKNGNKRERAATAALKPLYTDRELKKAASELNAIRTRLMQGMEEKRSKDLEAALSTSLMQGDDADIANLTYEKEMIFELSSNDRETIRQIDDALRKVQMKMYGYCEGCRKPIPKKRLKIIPYTKYCLVCQATYETKR